MHTHWTYADCDAGDDLFQGDIIARDPLLGLLRRDHAHFDDPKYLAFIVITQTCDLVLRHGQCKTQHISLAVVCSLAALMPSLLEEICDCAAPGVFAQESKGRAHDFLHRVLNQNEELYGMAYLHKDADAGIAEPAVGLLRVSFPIPANENYELLKQARRGRLDTAYRNKLGWLTGNLYSRVDTSDWSEQPDGEKQERAIIAELLGYSVRGRKPLWIPGAWLQAAAGKENLAQIPPDQIEATIRKYAPKPAIEVVGEEAKKEIEKIRNDFAGPAVESLKAKLPRDVCMMPLLGDAIRQVTHSTLEQLPAAERRAFVEESVADSQLREHVIERLWEGAQQYAEAKAAKQLPKFIEALQTMAVFNDAALSRLETLASEIFQQAFVSHAQAMRDAFANVKTPGMLIEHLKTLAVTCILEGLGDRVSGRLKNSTVLQSALKVPSNI